MKEEYERVYLEMIEFKSADIITTSEDDELPLVSGTN